MTVRAEITGVGEVSARLGSTSALRARVLAAVNKTAREVQRTVVTRYLVGPRPKRLVTGGPGNTGRLGRSINVQPLDAGAGAVGASVGTNVEYGRYWELGFDRPVGAGARGGPALQGKARERYFRKHPPGIDHEPAREFLRPALMDNADAFRARVRAAVEEAMR